MPKISVIVPVYNVEKYLNRCIDSILNQTFKDFELILVNDGSTDNSGKICDDYAIRDKRIRVIHKENGGLSSARNIGIKNSKGNYLGFVDSDDYIHPNMYEILYNSCKAYNAEISICSFKKVYENDIVDYVIDSNTYIEEYDNLEALHKLFDENGVQFVIACNKLYKKEIFDDLEYPINKIHEDDFIIHKVLYKSKKIIYIYEYLYYYFQRSDSIINTEFNIKKIDGLEAYLDRISFFKSIKNKELTEKAEFLYSREFFRIYYKLKNEVKSSYKERKNIRNKFILLYKDILKNPYYFFKEKVLILTFVINPWLYEKFNEYKGDL